MLKRVLQLSLALLMVLSLTSLASAAANLARNSQKGSLLVFPKIAVLQSSQTGTTVDTYLFIGNDNLLPTWVKCYWMDENQSIEDFHFYLTVNQPVVFSAANGAVDIGPPFADNAVGSLVCWAQDENDQTPRKFNHLYGYAMIQQGDGTSVFYNAYSFALRGDPPPYVEGSDTGTLLLNGDMYDMCPTYLVTNFITGYRANGSSLQLPNWRPDLALWPCKQDLRQDRAPTCTKAKFEVWNEYEVKFTGAYQCFKCYFEGFLDELGNKTGYLYSRGPGFGGRNFLGKILKTETARLRVQGVSSSVCDGYVLGSTTIPKTKGCGGIASVKTPFLGVMFYHDALFAADGNGFDSPLYLRPVAGYGLTGAGGDSTGFIQWNPATTVLQKKQK